MGSKKEINVKNRTYSFYNDIIDLKTFDSKNLCKNSVNPLYLCIDNANEYIEEDWAHKHLIFDSTDENKELLKRYDDVFIGLIDKVKKIDDNWLEYTKDYMKIKFNSNDNLPLNKPIKFYEMTITIKCVFSEDYKLYPQVFLDEALYSL